MIVYVRFIPESGHRSGHSRRQLLANARHLEAPACGHQTITKLD
jgi:hypothetical protein